jgi:hypothetical protein
MEKILLFQKRTIEWPHDFNVKKKQPFDYSFLEEGRIEWQHNFFLLEWPIENKTTLLDDFY